MPCPNHSHGVYQGLGTMPHLFGLFTRFINEMSTAGGRASEVSSQ